MYILILSSILRLGFPHDFFSSPVHTQNLYALDINHILLLPISLLLLTYYWTPVQAAEKLVG